MPIKNKTSLLVIIIIVLVILILYVFANRANKKEQICSDKLSTQFETILVEADDTGITLSGTSNTEIQAEILELIKQQCLNVKINNMIKINTSKKSANAWLNFNIDTVNNKITATGTVNNQKEVKAILKSFSDILIDMTVEYEINVNKNVLKKDFAITIILILSVIDDVKLVEISIHKDNLTLKGLVRDSMREQRVLSKLKHIFENEYTIINQLERVAKNKPDIGKLKFKLLPLPQLDN